MPEGDRRVFRQPEIKAMFIDDLERASRAQLAAPVFDIVHFTRPWGFSLRDIRVPIRFWHGDADNIVPLAHAQAMAALVPEAELRVRAGEGHIGNLAAAEEILDVILELWPAETEPLPRRSGATTTEVPTSPSPDETEPLPRSPTKDGSHSLLAARTRSR
jgi:hypothetical protein